MLTIKMLSDKSLVITQKARLYQRQSLVDNMQILVPSTYGEQDLTKYTATIEYIDPANIAHSEILIADTELYMDKFVRYVMPLDSKMTYMAGNILMKLTLTYFDEAEEKTYVLKTGELEIEILKLNDYFAYADEASLSTIDNKILALQAETDKLAVLAETYAENQIDDLALTGSLLQVSAKGVPKGEGVEIPTGWTDDQDGSEDGVIDVDVNNNSISDDNAVSVVEL